jgi:hypothetical protein
VCGPEFLRCCDRFYFRYVGEWLSLVEHLVRDQGVGGSNPLSPTNYRNPVIELASFPFSSFPQLGSIKQFLDFFDRCPSIRRDGMQVNFAGDFRRRMSENCLHCAQWSAYGVEQSPVCMSQPVPVYAGQPELLTVRLELSIDEIVPVKSSSRIRAEHQSVRIHCSWLASRENVYLA